MTEQVDSDRFERACAAIDAANAEDPNTIEYGGQTHTKELLHSQMMTEWVLRLDPSADELQLLAARANHFRRWTRPRSDYPEGRAGYLRWRAAAKQQHAREVGELLAGLGYSPDEIDRVAAVIRKERLASDPAVQTHEDALCLVFLQTQLDGVADRLGDDETVAILAKTIPKLTAAGVQAATTLDLGDHGAALLAQAVARLAPESRNDA